MAIQNVQTKRTENIELWETTKIFNFPRFSLCTIIANDQSPLVTIKADSGRGFRRLFYGDPWILFKISQKLNNAAFLAVKGGLENRSFKLDEALNLVIGWVEEEVLFRVEFFEEYHELRLQPFIAHQLAKILCETAIIALHKFAQSTNRIALIPSKGGFSNHESSLCLVEGGR